MMSALRREEQLTITVIISWERRGRSRVSAF